VHPPGAQGVAGARAELRDAREASRVSPASVTWAAATDVGARDENEDAWTGELREDGATGTARGLFIVCDGMGGHDDGQAASKLAIDSLRRELEWSLDRDWADRTALPHLLGEAVAAASRAIRTLNDRDSRTGSARAGTTVALMLLSDREVCIVHVGDSRVYEVTARGLRLLTEDHNIANREIRRGAEPAAAWERPDARHLTQALGPLPEDFLEPDIRVVQVEEPTLFLLCTDGLFERDFLEAHEAASLRPLLDPDVDLDDGCTRLVAQAARHNGHDNVTAVLVRIVVAAAREVAA
jgi:protein phosphatase